MKDTLEHRRPTFKFKFQFDLVPPQGYGEGRMRKWIIGLVLLVVVAACASAATWWWTHRQQPADSLTLYGNVDFRQVDLPFNNAERIDALQVDEGDRVTAGQVLATVDTTRLAARAADAEAAVAAQRAVVARLHHGTRPQEIDQARANVQAAQAEQINARQQYDRLAALANQLQGRAISKQDVENAQAALATASARLEVSRRALALAEAGPRQEDIDQAEAQLRSAEALLALAGQQLKDARLLAPADGVIRSRLMEVGEIASPQRPVYSLAITDPKWVRAYVSEPDLGKVHPGAKATITTDSFPTQRYAGWVGFISPAAEFTPKSVQTEELRSSLVYEVRVYVQDPHDQLRLGMPATVVLPLHSPAASTQPANSAQERAP
jgi:HlyD family secretion protein